LKIKVKVGYDYDPIVGDLYMVHWIGSDDSAIMLINQAALRPENHHILWNGIFHDLFEIACWTRGIYDLETESFLGFGHVFFSAVVTRVCDVGQRLFNKLTVDSSPSHKSPPKSQMIKYECDCGVTSIHKPGDRPVCPRCRRTDGPPNPQRPE